MKNVPLAICAVLALTVAGARAETLTQFLSGINLTPLAKGPMVLNLEAQSTTKTPQDDVNKFDDFFLINGMGKFVVNFDHALANKGQVAIPGWMGVAPYINHAITADIQDGWTAVKAHFKLTMGLGHVTVYRTLNTGQLVYDYAVLTSPDAASCQEYLYTPARMTFQKGLVAGCYWVLEQFHPSPFGTAGMLRR